MKNKILCRALLAIACVVTPGCSKAIHGTPEETTEQRFTLTTTVSLTPTKALDADGHKTFKAGDRIAVVYEDQSGEMVKAVSEELPAGDYGKSATFTVTLTDDPKESGGLTIIYPAAMAKADGSVNYDALAHQDGTLTSLGDNLDLAMYEGSLTGDATLPESISLTNRLAVCAFTLKNSDGSDEVTGTVTGLHIKAGTDSYYVSRSAAAGPIYVAMRPIASADVLFTAESAGGYYVKALTGKTYEANNLYPLGLKMIARPQAQFSVSNDKKVYFSPGNLQATTADRGDNWTWSFAPSQFAFVGDAAANTAVNGNGTVSANGTVDLFGWSTSATYYGIHNSISNAVYSDEFKDWGSLMGTGWRTLTAAEWNYVLNWRDYNFAKARVGGVDGIILLPDGWNESWYPALSMDDDNKGIPFSDNEVSPSDWVSVFEARGAVFLPAAGNRSEAEYSAEHNGYWSSSQDGDIDAKLFYFSSTTMSYASPTGRAIGYSVRLVKDVE